MASLHPQNKDFSRPLNWHLLFPKILPHKGPQNEVFGVEQLSLQTQEYIFTRKSVSVDP